MMKVNVIVKTLGSKEKFVIIVLTVIMEVIVLHAIVMEKEAEDNDAIRTMDNVVVLLDTKE